MKFDFFFACVNHDLGLEITLPLDCRVKQYAFKFHDQGCFVRLKRIDRACHLVQFIFATIGCIGDDRSGTRNTQANRWRGFFAGFRVQQVCQRILKVATIGTHFEIQHRVDDFESAKIRGVQHRSQRLTRFHTLHTKQQLSVFVDCLDLIQLRRRNPATGNRAHSHITFEACQSAIDRHLFQRRSNNQRRQEEQEQRKQN